MKSRSPLLWPLNPVMLVFLSVSALAATPHYVVTNNDHSISNSATFYTIRGASLTQKAVIRTGGKGNDGLGSVATKRVSILQNSSQNCAFIPNANSNDIAGIDIRTLHPAGLFKGSAIDNGSSQGIGVVNNGTYLYANFTKSQTIAAFQIGAECSLTFLQDVGAKGLGGASIIDMAAHGNILAVSYADGSISSFDTTGGVPVANGDLQSSTGHQQNGNVPSGVDIDATGRWALFGGTSNPENVEVSDISSGKLSPTVVYSSLGGGNGSEAIWISPDNATVYLSNFSSGTVTAAFLDQTTGILTQGCVSSKLSGWGQLWIGPGGLGTANRTGSGGALYVTEPDTYIAITELRTNGAACTFVEAPDSPINDSSTITVESIGVFPPRPF